MKTDVCPDRELIHRDIKPDNIWIEEQTGRVKIRNTETGADYTIELTGSEKLTMVLVPPGEFLMGSSHEQQAKWMEEAKRAGDARAIERIPSEGPQHLVRITQPFWLSRHEVTRGQFLQFANLQSPQISLPRRRSPFSSNSETRFLVPGSVKYQQSVCFHRQADSSCWRCRFRFFAIFD